MQFHNVFSARQGDAAKLRQHQKSFLVPPARGRGRANPPQITTTMCLHGGWCKLEVAIGGSANPVQIKMRTLLVVNSSCRDD